MVVLLFISAQLSTAPVTPPPPLPELPHEKYGLPGRKIEITDEVYDTGAVLPFTCKPESLNTTVKVVEEPKAKSAAASAKPDRFANVDMNVAPKTRFNRRGFRNH